MRRPVHAGVAGVAFVFGSAIAGGGVLGGCASTPAGGDARPGTPLATPVTMPAAGGTPPVALAYPVAARGEQVDVYGRERVADPYRAFEQLDAPATRAFVAAQNALAQPFLESIPERAAIKARLSELWNYERWGAALAGGSSYTVPVRRGGRYFYLYNTGSQAQSALYVADALDAPPRLLLDPSALAADSTIALANYEVAPDGAHVAWASSDGGSDWKTWRVRHVASGNDLPESLTLTKFTSVSWTPDSAGFYYSRYPALDETRGDDSKQVSIWYHRLGTPQDSDRFVYAIADHATRDPYAKVSDDGRYLVITVSEGSFTNGVYYLELGKPDADAVRLLDRWDGLYTYLGNREREFYFLTTADAPRGRIVAVDLDRPQPAQWRTLVAQGAEPIADAQYIGGSFVVTYLRDAHSVVRVHRADGSLRGELALPGPGQVSEFDGRSDDPEAFFSYTDFTTPRTVYRYDVAKDALAPFRVPTLAFDPARYVTEQVYYKSKDGTRVPMFVTRRRDLPRTAAQPTLLYGYGGFGIALLPGFSAPVATWLDMGGVYAVANLRGGSEYGEAWHQAGARARKQNVFDDFIAAAEWLIANKITSRERLAILGRSNGGLLVGATLLQRPDLFGAALPAVGVLDMLRYHTASANARQWSSDYGLSDDPEDFAAQRAYSPVHNVKNGVCYPPTLITTADHDDRVVPWHSYKFAAALQAAQASAPRCTNPILLRVETRAGHGAGKPTWMQVEDYADQWAFLARALRMDVTLPGGAAP